MVARAPLLLFQAVAASLLPHLTRLRARADETGDDAFRMSINTTLLTIAGFAAAVTVGCSRSGPEVMQIAFGDKFTYDRVGLAIVAVGMGFYLSGRRSTRRRSPRARRAAPRSAGSPARSRFVVWNLVDRSMPSARSRSGFAGSAALLAGLLYLLYPGRARSRRPSTAGSTARARGPARADESAKRLGRLPARRARASARCSVRSAANAETCASVSLLPLDRAGGFEEMSSATRLTPGTSLMIRFETRSSRS